MLWVVAPGLSSPELASVPFERVGRPLFPLDDVEDFDDRAALHISR